MIRPVTSGKLSIRHGKLADLSQIKTFTQDTFSWGDYVPGAWADWVRSKRGELFVAEQNKHIVGTLHVRYLEHHEAWLEGVRVRHEVRGQGIASALVQAAHKAARDAHCRIIRLETSIENLAAQRTFEKFGYRRLLHYAGFKGSARPRTFDTVRLAKPRDAKACWELWLHSGQKRTTRGIVPAVYGWRWWEFTRARLLNDIRAGRVWMTAHAFSIVRDTNDSLDITVLVGRKQDALTLLAHARMLTYQHKYKFAYWIAPLTAHTQTRAHQAEYTLDDDSLLIYACTL